MNRRLIFRLIAVSFLVLQLLLVVGDHAYAANSLTPDLPSGQPVGTTVTWTLTGNGSESERYRFNVEHLGGSVKLINDYRPDNVFKWTPIDEGTYVIIGSIMDRGSEWSIGAVFVVGPKDPLVSSFPLVTSTANPLIALYSAPPCPTGAQMRVVFFSPVGGWPLTSSSTNVKPCRPGLTMNFYIGGMRPNLAYILRHDILGPGGEIAASGPLMSFQTGSLPVTFPQLNIIDSLDIETSNIEKVILQSPVFGAFPFAADLTGNIIWYNESIVGLLTRPAGRGTFFIQAPDDLPIANQILRLIDLAGNALRETNVERINQQLTARGNDTINDIHHEAMPLPNGHVAFLGSVEKILIDIQGPGPVAVLGDMIVVLDENFQVVWTWNGFEHLDVTRLATLAETCIPDQAGCPMIYLDTIANDWMHTNAIAYSPGDGNLIISVRHQDWVIKIDYADGAGTGNVIWRLGLEGDFTIDSTDPSPWFSHQHDSVFANENVLTVYDNGNLRCNNAPDPCNSRGQVYLLDEQNMTASHLLNTDLGAYAPALGSSQPLINGNYYFNSGVFSFTTQLSTVHEVRPDGAIIYQLDTQQIAYRSHRMIDLYKSPPSWRLPQN